VERFEGVVARHARRSVRLDDVVHCLAIALGGKPAATLSRRVNVKVSNDTLLRIVRHCGVPSFAPLSIIGVDDWAWKRNHRYGTLICDLERRRTIALLPDREGAFLFPNLHGLSGRSTRAPSPERRLLRKFPTSDWKDAGPHFTAGPRQLQSCFPHYPVNNTS
jgi:hypothetical protein